MKPLFKSKRAPVKPNPLASIFHPYWSPTDDHALLKAKASGDNFTAIADRFDRPRIAIEQRWHRLRIVPDVLKKLEAFGLTSKSYPVNGGRK